MIIILYDNKERYQVSTIEERWRHFLLDFYIIVLYLSYQLEYFLFVLSQQDIFVWQFYHHYQKLFLYINSIHTFTIDSYLT